MTARDIAPEEWDAHEIAMSREGVRTAVETLDLVAKLVAAVEERDRMLAYASVDIAVLVGMTVESDADDPRAGSSSAVMADFRSRAARDREEEKDE